MYKFFTNNGQLIGFGLGAFISIVFIVIATSGIESFNALPKEEQSTTGIFDFGLQGAIALFVIAALAMLIFGVFQVATNFRNSLKGLIGLAVLVIIFIVAYSMAPSEPTGIIGEAADKFGGISSGAFQFIGAALTTMLIMLIVASITLLVSEVINFFK